MGRRGRPGRGWLSVCLLLLVLVGLLVRLANCSQPLETDKSTTHTEGVEVSYEPPHSPELEVDRRELPSLVERRSSFLTQARVLAAVLLAVAALSGLAWAYHRQRPLEVVLELQLLTDLQEEAETMADLVGTAEAQQHLKGFVDSLTEARQMQRKLKIGELAPSRDRLNKLMWRRKMGSHLREAVKHLRLLEESSKKAAEASEILPLPVDTWSAIDQVLNSAVDADFQNACRATLRSLSVQHEANSAELRARLQQLSRSPAFRRADQGWLLEEKLDLLVLIEEHKENGTHMAEMWQAVNSLALDAFKGASSFRFSAELQQLKSQVGLLEASCMLAKEALIEASSEEEQSLLVFLEEGRQLPSKLNRLVSAYTDLDQAAEPKAVVAAAEHFAGLSAEMFKDLRRCFELMGELNEVLVKGEAAGAEARALLHLSTLEAAEAAVQAQADVGQMLARASETHEQLLEGLPRSAQGLLQDTLGEQMVDSLLDVSEAMQQAVANAKSLASHVRKAKTVKRALKAAEESAASVNTALSARYLAATIHYKFRLLAVLWADMAASSDLASRAQLVPFTSAAQGRVQQAVRRFEEAVKDALAAADVEAVAEAASSMRASAAALAARARLCC
ncbi:hypothetical protein Efla_001689 [Eimeria flavescens]